MSYNRDMPNQANEDFAHAILRAFTSFGLRGVSIADNGLRIETDQPDIVQAKLANTAVLFTDELDGPTFRRRLTDYMAKAQVFVCRPA